MSISSEGDRDAASADDGVRLARFRDLLSSEMSTALVWASARVNESLPELDPGTIIEGKIAFDFMVECHQSLLQDHIPQALTSFSSATWLWYLRRVDPLVVQGGVATTAALVMRVAEQMSGHSQISSVAEKPVSINPLSYELGPLAASKVARLLALSVWVNRCEVWIRRAGKGQRFTVQSDGLPSVTPEDALETALERYDARSIAYSTVLWHPNIRLGTQGDGQFNRAILLASRRIEGWGDTFAWIGSINKASPFQIQGQFSAGFADLTDNADRYDPTGSVGKMSDASYAAALVVMARVAFELCTRISGMGIGIPSVGYALVHHDILVETTDSVIQNFEKSPWRPITGFLPTTSIEVIKALKKRKPIRERSANGPVLRTGPFGHVLDVYALTGELIDALRVDQSAGGGWVNAPAIEFEIATQQLIDSSKWRPAPDIASLRGVTLSNGKTNVTDADALMVANETLVLVSCKKVEHTQAYDRGDFARVRNSETTVVSALGDWAEKMDYLRANPRGTNYDFSSFKRIEGIVITPSVVFLRDISPLEDRDNLPRGLVRHMSFDELRSALHSADDA